MAGDARGVEGLLGEALHHQRCAQHGDPIFGPRIGGEHGGIGIRCSGNDDQIVRQAQGLGLLRCDRPENAAAGTDLRQCLPPGLFGKTGWPAVRDQIPTQTQVVAFFPQRQSFSSHPLIQSA